MAIGFGTDSKIVLPALDLFPDQISTLLRRYRRLIYTGQ
jgi:hypothetical protein